jgi:hypothetical protein
MFDAQQLTAKGANTSPAVYSPWMSRGGDNVIFSLDLVDKSNDTLQVQVKAFTKNTEDLPGAETELSTSIATTGTDLKVFSAQQDGEAKEQVRFEFKLIGTFTATDWALFRMIQPIWFDTV